MNEQMLEAQRQELVRRYLLLEKTHSEAVLKENLAQTRFLPSQAKVIAAYNDPQIRTILFFGPNQIGKTDVSARCLLATLCGRQPWDKRPRRLRPPVHVALLVEDYLNHANIYVEQKLWSIVPRSDLVVEERTQYGAPRVLRYVPTDSTVHIFTKDQESRRLESATWHEFYVDEPCFRDQFIAIARGLQKHDGKTFMTMTPLSEPWIYEEIFEKAYNQGGPDRSIFAITASPEENMVSHGGHLPDAGVESFRSKIPVEEAEARIYGKPIHLQGRIYSDFNDTHILKRDPVDPSTCPWGLVIDPHDRKPFFMIWFYIAPGNDIVFREEWPTFDFFQCRQWQWGIDDYVREITRHPKTFWRIMDPNYGRRTSMQTGLSISEQFQLRSTPDYPLAFDTTIDDSLEAGHKAVQDRLRWDKERPMSAMNQPHLYVHEDCRNTLRAFRNYTWDNYRGVVGYGKGPKEKPKEEFKDPMDVVRYAVMAQPRYLANPGKFDYRTSLTTRPGWAQHLWREDFEENALRPLRGKMR